MNDQGKAALEIARNELFDSLRDVKLTMTKDQLCKIWRQLREVEVFLAMLARGDFNE